MKLEVRLLESAEADIEAVYDWIFQASPQNADLWIEKFDARIQVLASHPGAGSVPKTQEIEQMGYRVLVLDKYLVFYVYVQGQVTVHRVIHGSRDYVDVLKHR